jgi:hypothetical protein
MNFKGCVRKQLWADLRFYPGIFLGWTEVNQGKSQVRIASLWAKILAWDLPNMKQKCCPLAFGELL